MELVLVLLAFAGTLAWLLTLTQRSGKLADEIGRLKRRLALVEAAAAASEHTMPSGASPAAAAGAASDAAAAAAPAALSIAVPAAAAGAHVLDRAGPAGAGAPLHAAVPPPAPLSQRAPVPPRPGPLDPVWQLVKANPFASAGIGMIVVGLGFLLSYLALQGLLPPWLRVGVVVAIGLALVAAGLRVEATRPSLAGPMQGGGLAVEYLSVLWAYQGYGLIDSMAAFALLAALGAAGTAWSLWKRRALFAAIGQLGAFLAPVLASTGGGTLGGLALYSICVAALGVGCALRLAMATLSGLALAGATVLLGAAVLAGLPAGGSLIAPAFAIFVLFSGAGLLHQDRASPSAGAVPLALLTLSPALALALIAAGHRGDTGFGACAIVIGAAQLLAALRAPAPLRPALALLGPLALLIGIQSGLAGDARSFAFVAAAFALGLVAAERRLLALSLSAALLWLAAWVTAIDLDRPFALAAAALAGAVLAWRSRGLAVSPAYLVAAPLAGACAILETSVGPPMLACLAAACALAVASAWLARRLQWSAVAFVGLYVVPAWLVAALSTEALRGNGAWGRLLLVFVGALLAVDRVLRLARLDAGPMQRGMWVAASILATLAIGWQGRIALAPFDAWYSPLAPSAGLGFVACWLAMAAARRLLETRSVFVPNAAAAVAITWGAASALALPPGATVEAMQWGAVAVALAVGLPLRWTIAGIATALALTVLRTVAALLQVRVDQTLELLFARAMQPSISALWAVLGVAVVYQASRAGSRRRWLAGAQALAVLVLKMLVVDLASFSVLAKVVVFVGVGLLFLALGYFSPLPPQREGASALPERA